jgi:DNA-binding response OmpR family regulator
VDTKPQELAHNGTQQPSTSHIAQTSDRPLLHVLMIDDAKSIVAMVRRGLEQIGGYRVSCAYNGEEGLNQFYAERPDCVVVDVMMPKMDGYQFVRCLRADRSACQTPLIMATALDTRADEMIGYLSGADLYVTKPYKAADLHEAIRRVVALTPEERERRIELLASGGMHPEAQLYDE